jgi:hypothetical protein
MRNITIKDKIRGLEAGLEADIFYDAMDYKDYEKADEIDDFRESVHDAIALLRALDNFINKDVNHAKD